MLEKHKNDKFLLFSNFPPDSSYKQSPKKSVKIGDQIFESWNADSYTKSTLLFQEWINKFSMAGINIVTGAPNEKLGDIEIKSLTHNVDISVTRKYEWIHPSLDFENMYLLFILEKIKEVVPRSPFI
ncbi:MAG: hypothetical protein JXB49_02630 [Bacteroidales bacterium]|nr:hypothetical protein [Bacteroidales bacterium]MBN2864158.1 hypothetical protein [Bacteroidales bacterium]